MQPVTVRVPATTANLGPAYDVLGLALDIWMEVRVSPADAFSIKITGQGQEHISPAEDNLIVRCTKVGFDLAGKPMVPLAFEVTSDIPFGCGCGSSSAAATAGVMAGLALCGHSLPVSGAEKLLNVVSEIEGHPDNAAPAIYGGLQLGYKCSYGFGTRRINMASDLWCVLFTPDKLMKQNTHATRKLIPDEVPMADAIHNMARVAIIVAALSDGKFDQALKDAADDRLHQPPRKHLFPHMEPSIKAAMEAGAAYAFLSGAGPTICAFVPGRSADTAVMAVKERLCDVVGKAMLEAARSAGVEGRAVVTFPSQVGAQVLSSQPLSFRL